MWNFVAHIMVQVQNLLDDANLLKRPLTEKLQYWFLRFSSQEIGSSLISLERIFEALQSELFRFKSHILSSKILKIPEFNLYIAYNIGLYSDENGRILFQEFKPQTLRRLSDSDAGDKNDQIFRQMTSRIPSLPNLLLLGFLETGLINISKNSMVIMLIIRITTS